jgi:hypothetical protein
MARKVERNGRCGAINWNAIFQNIFCLPLAFWSRDRCATRSGHNNDRFLVDATVASWPIG